jgi:hypothetical protein
VNRNTIALERPQSISKPNIQSYNGIFKHFSVKEQANATPPPWINMIFLPRNYK